jgi:hypothetical protein
LNILNAVLGFGLSLMLEVRFLGICLSMEKGKVGNLLEFTALRALRPSFFPLLSVLGDVTETEDFVYCAEVGKVELDVLKFRPSMDLGGVEDIV